MRSIIRKTKYRRVISFVLAFALVAGSFCFSGLTAEAKGSLSSGDCVKNVLVYAVNSQGQQVLISQLNVEDMLDYMNDNYATCGAVHNYSILDRLVTPVHQEAQGFTIPEMIAYAESKSSMSDLNLAFSGDDSAAFWEIDGSGFDAADTYTYNSLYGVDRYNFPALYQYWDYDAQTYKSDVSMAAIWAGREEETPLLSVTAYSQRYIDTTAKKNDGNYDMEGYFDYCHLLDTAKTVRLMLPMTESDLRNKVSTANDSRYGICYMLLDMESKPAIEAGTVAEPTCTVIDGDASSTDGYDAGCCYFTLDCVTTGASIYYNDSSQSNYMPTALYTKGQEIKVAKTSGIALLKVRAVKDGCVDAGVRTVTNIEDEDYEETVDPDADVWDGVSTQAAVGTEVNGVYTIKVDTCAQLKWVADQVNSGVTSFAGVTIRLGNNLHLDNKDWQVIGENQGIKNAYGDAYLDYTYTFSGTFDGDGYTVSGLKPYTICNDMGWYYGRCGLFGSVSGAEIKDLTVSGVVSSGVGGNIGGIGGIAGEATNSTFKNCVSYARIKADSENPLNGGNRGGIVGKAYGCTLTDCVNYGDISGFAYSSSGFGGIAGKTVRGAFTGCENYGGVSCSYTGYCGGIIGLRDTAVGAAGDGVARYCNNYGEVNGGGVVGYGSASYCTNYGEVNGGGILYQGTASCCINNGTVNGSGILVKGTADACVNAGDTVNGLIGGGTYTEGTNKNSSLTNSYNTGASSNAGLAGSTYTNLSNCYNANGGAALGGYIYGTMTLSNLYYLNTGTEVAGYPARDLSPVVAMAEADLQAGAFVTALNTNAGTALFTANTAGVNGGFPKFTWESNVMFEEGNGMEYAPWHLITGSECPVPEDPVKSGYAFTGWYSDEECTAFYDFTSPVASDITLYAGWEKTETAAPVEKEVVLSWSGDPTTTQTVTWYDDSDTGYVQYVNGSSYQGESSFTGAGQVTASPSSVENYWQATITGLAPDTEYCYRVGSSGDWSDVYRFTTAKSGIKNFSFLYLGDIQYDSNAAAEYQEWGTMLESAYDDWPDLAFGLTGGDMVEDESISNMSNWTYFLSYASNVFSKIPMMTANGNHESNFSDGKPQIYTAVLGLPTNGPAGFSEEFYSFDYGTVHVTVLNSWALSDEQNLSAASAAAINTWITNDLTSASSAKFRIVVMHHPAYALQSDAVSSEVLAEWVPLLEAGVVDLVFCGHQHIYARSYPIADGTIDYGAGITYVMGNSGQQFYSNADTTYQAEVIYNKSTYQIIDISGNTMSLCTYDRNGKLLDSWSMTSRVADVTGDVNSDGKVDMDDVDMVFNAYLMCKDYNSSMDVNNDGAVDIRDAHLVLKICLGKTS